MDVKFRSLNYTDNMNRIVSNKIITQREKTQ